MDRNIRLDVFAENKINVHTDVQADTQKGWQTKIIDKNHKERP